MEMVVNVAVALVWIAAAGAVVSGMRLPDEAWARSGRTLGGTVLFIILTGGLGGLYYWLVIRREVLATGAELRDKQDTKRPA